MIKKAQIKFVIIIMSILFITFSVVFASTLFLFNSSTENTAVKIIRDTKKSFILSDGHNVHPNGLIVLIDSDGRVLESFYDHNVFSKDNADKIIKTVLSYPYDAGKVDNVFYSIENYKVGYLLVASDLTDVISAYRMNSLTAFIVFISIYGLLFLIVWLLSFKVFAPIKESFFKQKQFVSNASHELKTPLTIISANADVLGQEVDNHWLDNIKEQTERMNVLIADMLSLAKIDEDKVVLKKEKFNLSQIVLGTCLPFDAVAFEKGKNLNIDVEENIQYFGDVQSVKTVVGILIDNAVKHAELNSDVLVSLKKESNKIVLSVFNLGSQIPDIHSNKIFERFYRGDSSRSRESGGSGLGLSIAKSIADKNKWRISAVSKFNESMKITVIF